MGEATNSKKKKGNTLPGVGVTTRFGPRGEGGCLLETFEVLGGEIAWEVQKVRTPYIGKVGRVGSSSGKKPARHLKVKETKKKGGGTG